MADCSAPFATEVYRYRLDQCYCVSNGSDYIEDRRELERCVAEGIVLGAIPRCPECNTGRLRFDRMSDLYTCKGFVEFDEPNRAFCY